MERRVSFSDVVASAGLAAVIGGFTMSSAIAGWMLGIDNIFQRPMQTLGGMVLLGFIGVMISLFTAWPAGIALGGLIWKFVGEQTFHAVAAGTLTALTLFCSAMGNPMLEDPTLWVPALLFAAGGGLIGGFSFWYVMKRAARFDTER